MKKLIQKLKNKLTNYLLNTITVDDVLVSRRGKLYIDGKPLSEGELNTLNREAHDLLDSRLYKILSGTVSSHAQKTIFTKSMSFDDVWAGKMLLMAIDLQRNIINKLAKDD